MAKIPVDEATEEVWRDLAPGIVRQRLIIEGTTPDIVKPPQIKKYLLGLARVTDMQVIGGPFTRSAHECGFAGWIHWKTSGGHFYSYPRDAWGGRNDPLFTVDTYTCKPFSVEEAVRFTRDYLHPLEIVWREV